MSAGEAINLVGAVALVTCFIVFPAMLSSHPIVLYILRAGAVILIVCFILLLFLIPLLN
jgi:hypothetical protein